MPPDSILETPPAAAPAPATPGSALSPPATPPADPNAAKPWYPDSHKGLVELKGWKDVGAALESYANLEKIKGVDPKDVLVRPKDAADKAARDAIAVALGRPDKVEGYTKVEGLEGDAIVSAFDKIAFEEGIPDSARTKLLNWYVEQGKTLNAEVAAAETVHQEKRLERLKAEQGPAFDAMLEDARRAHRTIVPETYKDPATGHEWTRVEIGKAIEDAVGVDLAVRIMAGAGKFTGEDSWVQGKPPSGIMGAEAAQHRKQMLMRDTAWVTRWANKGTAEREEMSKLDIIIASAQRAA
jgi:hypothetical protein